MMLRLTGELLAEVCFLVSTIHMYRPSYSTVTWLNVRLPVCWSITNFSFSDFWKMSMSCLSSFLVYFTCDLRWFYSFVLCQCSAHNRIWYENWNQIVQLWATIHPHFSVYIWLSVKGVPMVMLKTTHYWAFDSSSQLEVETNKPLKATTKSPNKHNIT